MNTIQRLIPTVAGYLLGAIMMFLGMNGLLRFLPQPPVPAEAGSFLGALAATGYMFPLISLVEVVGGVMLLSGRFVPLALALLAPVVVNAVLFHAVLSPAGLGVVLIILALEIGLAAANREAYAPMLRAHTETRSTRKAILVSPAAAS